MGVLAICRRVICRGFGSHAFERIVLSRGFTALLLCAVTILVAGLFANPTISIANAADDLLRGCGVQTFSAQPASPNKETQPEPGGAASNNGVTTPQLMDKSAPPVITSLSDSNCSKTSPLTLGLDDDLGVGLSQPGAVDASTFVLFLKGREAISAGNAIYDGYHKRLIFHLQRDPANADAWKRLLGAPLALRQTVDVALGVTTKEVAHPQPSIVSADGSEPSFEFQMISGPRLAIAVLAIGAILIFVWGNASRTAIVKDNLIPQIDPARQTYSLGRWQMAFWFSLVIASYLFLFILLDDYNTVSTQALMLMGISGATAFAAIEVDAIKDSPADAVNQGLRLIGIRSWTDVVRIKAEIADRQEQLASTTAPPPATSQAQLASEILDRQLKLRSYEEAIAPFVSEGWFRDLVTDLNGTALHRLQVFCWTWVLGGIFLYGVWRDLAMPNFSNTLLALMGVSSVGYVGFKYPETQQ